SGAVSINVPGLAADEVTCVARTDVGPLLPSASLSIHESDQFVVRVWTTHARFLHPAPHHWHPGDSAVLLWLRQAEANDGDARVRPTSLGAPLLHQCDGLLRGGRRSMPEGIRDHPLASLPAAHHRL